MICYFYWLDAKLIHYTTQKRQKKFFAVFDLLLFLFFKNFRLFLFEISSACFSVF